MLEALLQGGLTLVTPPVVYWILPAVLLGIVIGIIPGIGGLIGVALLLPFIYHIPPEIGLTFLIVFHAVTFTGGSISAILINIPGTGVNAATLIDGFPMTQKGEGGRALGAAITASTMGGILSVPMGLLMIPLIIPIVMAFKSPEMFMVVVLGLTFIAVLASDAPIKGLIGAALGMFFALIGYQVWRGIPRFTFGSMFLYGGLGVVPVVLGLFGLVELIDMFLKGQVAIATKGTTVGGMQDVLRGAKDVFYHKWLWLRSTVVGYLFGVIPGVGAETATFVAYGQAKQISKNPEKFGTGCVEGVIAPESANNAKDAGALLTTLAFGIPGSTVMAILLGGFLLVGITPGPKMLVDHLPLSFTLLLGIVLANLIGGIICLSVAPQLIKIARVHVDFLFTMVLALILAGAFVSEGYMLDIPVVIIFGLLGLFMKRLGYSRPAFILAFVLGTLFEYYLQLSVDIYGPLFFVTPISLAMVLIIVGLFAFPYLRAKFSRRSRSASKAGSEDIKEKGIPYFALFTILLALYVIGSALSFENPQARLFPSLVGGILLALSVIDLVKELQARKKIKMTMDERRQVSGKGILEWRRLGLVMGWVVGASLGVYLIGFLLAIPIFVLSYLKQHGRSWSMSIGLAAGVTAMIYGMFELGLQVHLYRGLIFLQLF